VQLLFLAINGTFYEILRCTNYDTNLMVSELTWSNLILVRLKTNKTMWNNILKKIQVYKKGQQYYSICSSIRYCKPLIAIVDLFFFVTCGATLPILIKKLNSCWLLNYTTPSRVVGFAHLYTTLSDVRRNRFIVQVGYYLNSSFSYKKKLPEPVSCIVFAIGNYFMISMVSLFRSDVYVSLVPAVI
jgi:hypothetical protein